MLAKFLEAAIPSIGLLLYLVFNCIAALIMQYCKYLFRSVFLLLERKLMEHILIAYLFLIETNYFRIQKSYKNSRESLHIPHFSPTKESTLVH